MRRKFTRSSGIMIFCLCYSGPCKLSLRRSTKHSVCQKSAQLPAWKRCCHLIWLIYSHMIKIKTSLEGQGSRSAHCKYRYLWRYAHENRSFSCQSDSLFQAPEIRKGRIGAGGVLKNSPHSWVLFRSQKRTPKPKNRTNSAKEFSEQLEAVSSQNLPYF